MAYSTRNIELWELKNIYNRIEQDFAEGEYPPYDKLYKQLEAGMQRGTIFTDEGRDVAYSICAESETGYVLLSLLAVYPEYRGKGYGSAFLENLKNVYSDKNGIIVEVEKPEDVSGQEKAIREKRINFYQKSGFSIILGIEYSIWDVPMHLMALPLNSGISEIADNMGQIIYDIYLMLLGKRFIYKLEFRKINQ